MSILQSDVDETLDAAEDNGYAPSQWDGAELTGDLIEFSATFESCEEEALRPLVADWQRRHPPVEGAPRRGPFT